MSRALTTPPPPASHPLPSAYDPEVLHPERLLLRLKAQRRPQSAHDDPPGPASGWELERQWERLRVDATAEVRDALARERRWLLKREQPDWTPQATNHEE